jgi:hypothetical protein
MICFIYSLNERFAAVGLAKAGSVQQHLKLHAHLFQAVWITRRTGEREICIVKESLPLHKMEIL